MAYRGTEAGGPACSRHASSPAAASCHQCRAELCEICIVYWGSDPHCYKCARRRRRARAVSRWALIAASVALAGGAAGFLLTRKAPFDYGANRLTIARLRADAEKDRCAQQATLDYGDALVAAGDYHGALDDAAAYFKQCGDWYRLRWVTYTAHERLHDYPAAAAEATRLIEHRRNDHDYWWWRGSIYEQMKDWDKAASDYRQSLVLLPRSNGIPFNLSRVYERRHEDCRALGPLEHYVYEHPDDSQPTRDRILMLAAQRGCLRDGQGRAVIKHYYDAHALDGKVVVAGKVRARFMLAPESMYTEISPALAEKLGLDLKGKEALQVDVDGELEPALLVTLPSLAVGAARARDIEAAVAELPEGVDGSIGISFLARFSVEQDEDAETFSLFERAREAADDE